MFDPDSLYSPEVETKHNPDFSPCQKKAPPKAPLRNGVCCVYSAETTTGQIIQIYIGACRSILNQRALEKVGPTEDDSSTSLTGVANNPISTADIKNST